MSAKFGRRLFGIGGRDSESASSVVAGSPKDREQEIESGSAS